MRPICTLLVLGIPLVLSVFGCGGGRGGGSLGPIIQPPPVLPSLEITLQDGGGSSSVDMVEYLGIHASGGPWTSGLEYEWQHDPGLVRFEEPPTVHLVQDMTDRERAITHYAVALINRALPYDWHIEIGSDVPVFLQETAVPDGQIHIGFPTEAPDYFTGRSGSEAASGQSVYQEYDEQQQRWEKMGLRAANVWMNRTHFDARGDDEATLSVLVHELMHALGLQGHVESSQFTESNSYQYGAWEPLTGGLVESDANAIYALYTRLGPATEPEELSAQSLGPWDQETTVLMGQFGDLSFGVTHQNGLNRPWTNGTKPDTDLSDNHALTGTVTWEGGLVGFTPTQNPVSGDASLSVNLGTLDGQASFTELQSWPVETVPTQGMGGTQWRDGNLEYDIAVSGNFLRSTGGDDGVVSGTFYGLAHEGVAGSLERTDLTASFGAKRE